MISIRDPQTMLLPSRDTPACPAVQIVDYHPQPLTQPQASTSARDPRGPAASHFSDHSPPAPPLPGSRPWALPPPVPHPMTPCHQTTTLDPRPDPMFQPFQPRDLQLRGPSLPSPQASFLGKRRVWSSICLCRCARHWPQDPGSPHSRVPLTLPLIGAGGRQGLGFFVAGPGGEGPALPSDLRVLLLTCSGFFLGVYGQLGLFWWGPAPGWFRDLLWLVLSLSLSFLAAGPPLAWSGGRWVCPLRLGGLRALWGGAGWLQLELTPQQVGEPQAFCLRGRRGPLSAG